MTERSRSAPEAEHVALVELVNRVVDKGVVLNGQLTISVAEVDLLFVGLQVLLCSADRVLQPVELGSGARRGLPPGDSA
jgi:hypothetical protein